MPYGPGSDPELHQNTETYCYRPVLTAVFIPSESVSPPLRFHLLLYEVKDQVYGQILSERQHWQFPEHPLVDPDMAGSIHDVEYESSEHFDPLVALTKTVNGLHQVAERFGDFEPILDSVEVINEKYIEAGKDLVNHFATALSKLEGAMSELDLISNTLGQQNAASFPQSGSL